ncbi:hypothetical protein ILUMI_18293 [Ignelater luminosus]|uniref:MD-2-related lipid-recognition domain-containing protein n=1 Tax=Ignelater luminosus TaxID=2038154 RepID=A0A8K0G116_IGNLU|nr:hypothetical protein ILUMI_18293 [Ignelater luminosus]
MHLSIYSLLLAIGEIIAYHQNDYEVVSERYEIPIIAFRKRVKLQIKVEAYKFASNEYRGFPMDSSENACAVLSQNKYGVNVIYKCGNLPHCPFKRVNIILLVNLIIFLQGNYTLCNFQPDYKQFPPYIPSGRYRLDFIFTYGSDTVYILQWMAQVKRKFD